MRIVNGPLACMLLLATLSAAEAKGCMKGAVVGGVAGHYAGHHGFLGAAAGCAVGRHEANKRAREQRETTGRGSNEDHER